MGMFGKPTIHPVLFVLAKVAVVPPHVLLSLAALHASQGRLAYPRLAPVALAAVIAGLTVAALSIRQLGESVRVGLPDEPTEFKTRGLYRYSRNPIYAGLFLSTAGSCVLVPHWINLVSTATAMLLHHRIILGEERFLDGRFGPAWKAYRARVRRYI